MVACRYEFPFSCSTQYLTRSLRSLVSYRVWHSRRNSISARAYDSFPIYRIPFRSSQGYPSATFLSRKASFHQVNLLIFLYLFSPIKDLIFLVTGLEHHSPWIEKHQEAVQLKHGLSPYLRNRESMHMTTSSLLFIYFLLIYFLIIDLLISSID